MKSCLCHCCGPRRCTQIAHLNYTLESPEELLFIYLSVLGLGGSIRDLSSSLQHTGSLAVALVVACGL